MKNLIFKSFEPFRDVIEDVSDERCYQQGIWVYPIQKTSAAESVCAPGTLHEDTVKELIAQLRDVADEIRNRPSEYTEETGEAQGDDTQGNLSCGAAGP